jgi:predicted porin
MNNTIKLAVASALLAAASSASAAGGIVAGDWTLDIGGIVNAYYTNTKFSGAAAGTTGPLALGAGNGASVNNITTGLLPNYLTVSGKTRQNDLDVTFLISMNPGSSSTQAGIQDNTGNDDGGANGAGGRAENRQAFLTFGDASWGSFKLGKDLGIYASDAILNDMTLLGVGAGAGSLAGNTTTLGRIGTGFMYADWKSQIAFTTANYNGFSATVGVTQAWNATAGNWAGATSTRRGGNNAAYEGKVAYAFAGDVSGKVWASGISQKVEGIVAGLGGAITDPTKTVTAWDLGANVNAGGFGLTGYYGEGKGIGQTFQLNGGFDADGDKRKSEQYYIQGTFVVPGANTKLGVSYGESKLNETAAEGTDSTTDEMVTFGAYHPLTKHLNLVAEYSESKRTNVNDVTAKASTVSLGAILFF